MIHKNAKFYLVTLVTPLHSVTKKAKTSAEAKRIGNSWLKKRIRKANVSANYYIKEVLPNSLFDLTKAEKRKSAEDRIFKHAIEKM